MYHPSADGGTWLRSRMTRLGVYTFALATNLTNSSNFDYHCRLFDISASIFLPPNTIYANIFQKNVSPVSQSFKSGDAHGKHQKHPDSQNSTSQHLASQTPTVDFQSLQWILPYSGLVIFPIGLRLPAALQSIQIFAFSCRPSLSPLQTSLRGGYSS